jgi:hypothetical protein
MPRASTELIRSVLLDAAFRAMHMSRVAPIRRVARQYVGRSDRAAYRRMPEHPDPFWEDAQALGSM